MQWAKAIGFVFSVINLAAAPSARALQDRLSHLAIDPQQTYRVRDLRLSRGGVKIYLNDGVLAFAEPVEGKVIAAVFTTRDIDTGDAEVLALPPNRSERVSLANFTKSPNLNDHFQTAVFFFSDATQRECLSQIEDSESHKDPALAAALAPELNPILTNIYPNFDINLIDALLDQHRPEEGFFYGTFAGRSLGPFNLLYDPTNTESVTIGQIDSTSKFRLWTSFRAAQSAPPPADLSRFSNYRITARIAPSLQLAATATFDYRCHASNGRSLRFDLSDRLTVSAASLDGQPVEFFQRRGGSFLVVAPASIPAGVHLITVAYGGEVIRRTALTYFVEERNTWYPHAGTTSAVFDLTFECPASLQLVSIGEPVSDLVADGVRTVRRKTVVAENVAGFNLGEYRTTSSTSPPYRIDIYANRSRQADEDLGSQTAAILQTYSRWWSTLPFHTIAISPVEGYFGQGFPGLIYLSDVSYVKPVNRPAPLRTARMESFFSDMLLPHEVAHQWWGNVVVPADYRAGWLAEAMATHAALEFVNQKSGESARSVILAEYKKDLLARYEGQPVETLGPVDFGVRLIDSVGKNAWQVIVYEKGAWVLRMLQSRLGDERWRQLQASLLKDFSARPLNNDSFRQQAARFLPAGQPDPDLQQFFETWVYSTGIPVLALARHSDGWELEVSDVSPEFTADIPLQCQGLTRWVRASLGTNVLPASESKHSCSLPQPDRFLYVSDHQVK